MKIPRFRRSQTEPKHDPPELLAITPPRTGERTLLGVENMLRSIAVPEPLSLEVAADSRGARLIARCVAKETVRAQIAAHYPQAVIDEMSPEDDPLLDARRRDVLDDVPEVGRTRARAAQGVPRRRSCRPGFRSLRRRPRRSFGASRQRPCGDPAPAPPPRIRMVASTHHENREGEFGGAVQTRSGPNPIAGRGEHPPGRSRRRCPDRASRLRLGQSR